MEDLSTKELIDHLNRQTSKISWRELERYYAQGAVYFIEKDIDLINVATAFIQDDVLSIKEKIDTQKIRQVEVEEAQQWHNDNIILWAVVAAPWVLIQKIKSEVTH